MKARDSLIMSKKIITISRQYGSGGRLIAQRLSEKLGVPFYDRALIEMAAKESGYEAELFENLGEQHNSNWFYNLSLFGNSTAMQDLPLNDKIFLAQASVIRKVADEGSCVIVGRCADYVLRDRKDCVNVFIHSDLASRIKRATEQYGLSPVKAGDEINKIDKQRATYYRYYSEKKWGRAENYDLSVYSDSIGLEACTDLILSFVDMKLSHRD